METLTGVIVSLNYTGLLPHMITRATRATLPPLGRYSEDHAFVKEGVIKAVGRIFSDENLRRSNPETRDLARCSEVIDCPVEGCVLMAGACRRHTVSQDTSRQLLRTGAM